MKPVSQPDVVGIIPAAGTGSRLGAAGSLKELLPVWTGGEAPPSPACACLLHAFAAAGVTRAVFVVRPGKEGLRQALGSEAYGVGLDYMVAECLDGPSYSIDTAARRVPDSIVAIGFPDILFAAPNPFRAVVDRLRSEPFDAVLGMFPVAPGQRADRVTLDPGGRVLAVESRPVRPNGRPTWAVAAWTPAFSRYLHDVLRQRTESGVEGSEPVVGDILSEAIGDGIAIGAQYVSDRPFLDIGTPEGLTAAYAALERESDRR